MSELAELEHKLAVLEGKVQAMNEEVQLWTSWRLWFREFHFWIDRVIRFFPVWQNPERQAEGMETTGPREP